MQIGEGFRANGPVWIEAISSYGGREYSPILQIGRQLRASNRLHITCVSEVTIGNNCLFGSDVFIGDHSHGEYGATNVSHPSEPPANRILGSVAAVKIGSNVWLGDNVKVLAGADIGDGAIVGANSVVNGPIPPNTISVGAPASPVRRFDENDGAWVRHPDATR